MSQICNDNTKRPKPKENQLGILGIMLEIQQRASSPGDSAAGATYLSLRMHPKSCRISPLKVTATLTSVQEKTQLEHNSHIVNVGIETTC